MFRSRLAKEQHEQSSNPLRSALRQRLGLQPIGQDRSLQPHIHPLEHPTTFATQQHVSQTTSLLHTSTFHAQQPTSQSTPFQNPTTLSAQQSMAQSPPMEHVLSPQLDSSSSQSSHVRCSTSQRTFHQHGTQQSSVTSCDELQHSEDQIDDELDNNEAKLLWEVEIIDQGGEVIRLQKMCAKDVYKDLRSREKILVHVNDLNQPIKAAGGLCTRFMTLLIEQPNLCPPDAKDWKEAKKVASLRLIRELRGKFALPVTAEVDNMLLSIFNSKFRSYRFKLKTRALKEAKNQLLEMWENEIDIQGEHRSEQEGELVFTEEELLQVLDFVKPPSGLSDRQWDNLKDYFRSTKGKELSRKGKAARATQIHTRTTGSTSYARKKDEFKICHKRDPFEVEFFDITHVTKKGSYVQQESKEFMDVAKQKISEKMEGLEPCERDDPIRRYEIEKAVMQNLMGPDKPGRARGYGIGVTKSQVSDLSNDLRKMRNENLCSNQVNKALLNRLDKQDKLISTMAHTINDLRGELRIFHAALGIFNGGSMSQSMDPLFTNGTSSNAAAREMLNDSSGRDAAN